MKIPRSRFGESGLTLVEACVVLLILVVLFFLLIPMGPHAKPRARRISCLSNLKQIGLAVTVVNNEHGPDYFNSILSNRSQVWHAFSSLSNAVDNPKVLRCPSDNSKQQAVIWESTLIEYGANRIPQVPRMTNDIFVSYFIGLGSQTGKASALLLAGDRNLHASQEGLAWNQFKGASLLDPKSREKPAWSKKNIHKENGNTLQMDGSASMLTTPGLQKVLVENGSSQLIVKPLQDGNRLGAN